MSNHRSLRSRHLFKSDGTMMKSSEHQGQAASAERKRRRQREKLKAEAAEALEEGISVEELRGRKAREAREIIAASERKKAELAKQNERPRSPYSVYW